MNQKLCRVLFPLCVVWIACIATPGCLSFGEDIERVDAEITSAEFQRVASLTGVVFPPGTIGRGYLYVGSGIDDAMGFKAVIPAAERDAFVKNPVFETGDDREAYLQIGRSRPWWRLETMTDRIDRGMDLPSGQYLECTLGVEDGELTVYLSWSTM